MIVLNPYLAKVLDLIFNPLGGMVGDKFRYIIVGSKIPHDDYTVKIKKTRDFIDLFRRYYGKAILRISTNIFMHDIYPVDCDRIFFDVDDQDCVYKIIDYMYKEYNMLPLIIKSPSKGYHLVYFIELGWIQSNEYARFISKIILDLYDKANECVDLYYTMCSHGFHVVPYCRDEIDGKFTCICDLDLKCIDPKRGLKMIDNALNHIFEVKTPWLEPKKQI